MGVMPGGYNSPERPVTLDIFNKSKLFSGSSSSNCNLLGLWDLGGVVSVAFRIGFGLFVGAGGTWILLMASSICLANVAGES